MPHIKIAGVPEAEELWQRLRPWQARDESGVQKVRAYYLDQDRRLVLAEALVADGGLPRVFFVSLAPRDGTLTLRCLPATDPEKTPAVKRLIVRLALHLRECCPGAELVGGNLPEETAELDGA